MYRYEIQQRQQTTRARGKGAEGRGGRNCGTFHGEVWKQRAVTDDECAAIQYVSGLGADWRVFDHVQNEPVQLP